MTENEEKILAISLRKAKIRERYKGVDQNGLDVIPAVPKKDLQAESAKMRVGAYVRVSTDDPRPFCACIRENAEGLPLT